MIYQNITEAVFLERPNRFIARVLLNGAEEIVHVKNTGRCKELLVPGARVWLSKGTLPGRKTAYDLISVEKAGLGVVNIDSQAPNRVAYEWLVSRNMELIKPEYRWGESRLDFYTERKGERFLIEVKGCTLESDGIGYFPDAPTERGARHLGELKKACREGYRGILLFVLPMPGILHVEPNRTTDRVFSKAYDEAKAAGVEVYCLACHVTPGRLEAVEGQNYI